MRKCKCCGDTKLHLSSDISYMTSQKCHRHCDAYNKKVYAKVGFHKEYRVLQYTLV